MLLLLLRFLWNKYWLIFVNISAAITHTYKQVAQNNQDVPVEPGVEVREIQSDPKELVEQGHSSRNPWQGPLHIRCHSSVVIIFSLWLTNSSFTTLENDYLLDDCSWVNFLKLPKEGLDEQAVLMSQGYRIVISQPTSTYVWKPQKTRIIQRKRRLQSHFSDRLQHSVYFTRRIRKRKGGGKFLLMFFLHHSTYNSDFHSITPSLTTTNTFAQYEQRNMLNLSVTTPINLWPLLCYRRVTGNEYVKEAFQLSNAS